VIYRIKPGFMNEIQLMGQINNLFNVRYEPNGYSFSYVWNGAMQTENFVYPMAGFHLLGGLQWTFGQP
jgi:iron complex outermembrane receptor protein